jgi:phosphomannomutase
LKAEGRSLLDAVDDLDRTYGVHLTSQVSVRSNDADALRARIDALLSTPPMQVGGLAVLAVNDLSSGLGGLPPTEGVRLVLAGPTEDGSARVVVRPSGTEPKLKAYLEVVVPLGEGLLDGRSSPHGLMARTTNPTSSVR